MALKAKKPVVQDARFKAVVYANRGVGKTHFCCSFPDSYFVDSEGLSAHPHFVEMLVNNGSDLARINELSEIIAEVKTLLSTKHNYKTLIIDSISFPFHLLANMEAERLSKKGKGDTEGTEFGANMAKAKRQVFELGMLLSRLDLNVLVTAHEKTKYQNGEEIGKVSDVSDKLEYALGSVIHLRRQGKFVKAFIEKSRYTALPTGEMLDFSEGYDLLCERLGKQIFEKESIPEMLATPEQIDEVSLLIQNLSVPEDWLNKKLASYRASKVNQLNTDDMAALITLLKSRLDKKPKGEEE